MIHKYLAYLKTIETGSITQAAAELGYTQSAVSRMIADLEEHWDVPLLTRNRSGIEISSEGTQLLPILQSIVKGQEELSFAVGELHGLQSGLIRVGAFTSMATGWMPLMIKSFHEKYPNIRFQIFNGEYNQIATWLRRGQIDCGFLALPCAKEFDTTFLLRDSLTVILPPNHPLRDAECFPVSRLSDEDFISLKEEQDYEINLFLEHLRQSPRIKFEVSSDFAILAMVECGLGISVVHDLILHNYGPGRTMGSCHVEVRSDSDFVAVHEVVDLIEREIEEKLHILMTIHMDPVEVDNAAVNHYRHMAEQVIAELHQNLSLHDFRLVSGENTNRLIFDILVPFDCTYTNDELLDMISGELSRMDKTCQVSLTFDRDFT